MPLLITLKLTAHLSRYSRVRVLAQVVDLERDGGLVALCCGVVCGMVGVAGRVWEGGAGGRGGGVGGVAVLGEVAVLAGKRGRGHVLGVAGVLGLLGVGLGGVGGGVAVGGGDVIWAVHCSGAVGLGDGWCALWWWRWGCG